MNGIGPFHLASNGLRPPGLRLGLEVFRQGAGVGASGEELWDHRDHSLGELPWNH